MIIFNKAFMKVWKVDIKEKYTVLSCSTGDKQVDGTYKNSNWNVKLVGKANVDVKEGDRITVLGGKVENVWDKEKQRNWLNVIVWDVEVEEIGTVVKHDDELPF